MSALDQILPLEHGEDDVLLTLRSSLPPLRKMREKTDNDTKCITH